MNPKEGIMFMIFVFLVGWILGAVLTLRFIKTEGNPYHLTRAGKIVYASFAGIMVGLFIVLVDGMWWNCDSGTCQFAWGY